MSLCVVLILKTLASQVLKVNLYVHDGLKFSWLCVYVWVW